ncbi:translocation/assembly module TamB domain-containing protein [Fodinibius salsisoli]|uniref:AsmA domain-containing protein n=1 Tax=Fodinibius salsisoli TaxID=2820877 RepID=A0ABT3PLQ5_9BACT|nr:hypothetical protein [Fodinibius salsisoli]MCW9706658.1 hypothetical protein [Fodinibius salsisoli]
MWGTVLIILLVVLIGIGGAVGLLQLDAVQDYLIDRVESRVAQNYKANLSVGAVDGFVPFNIQLQDVVVTRGDSAKADTVATIAEVENQIDIWSLLQNKVSVSGLVIREAEVWMQKNEAGQLTLLERIPQPADTSNTVEEPWLSNVEILAPRVEVVEGVLHLESPGSGFKALDLPNPVTISSINANFFLEWTEQQRYLDIEGLSAESTGLDISPFSMTGQVYSDQRYLEFNSFYVHFGSSEIILNGEIDGIDIGTPGFIDQFLAARYDLDVEATALYPQEFKDILPATPDVEGPFTVQLRTEGSTDSLWVDEVSLGKGESLFRLNGLFQNLQQQDAFAYRVSIDSVNLRKEDVRPLVDTLKAPRYRALEDLTMKGTANGSLDSIYVDLALHSPLGSLDLQGGSQLKAPHQYTGNMMADSLDVSWLNPTVLDTTSLNFDAQITGSGFNLEQAGSDLNVTFSESLVDRQTFDQLQLNSSLNNKVWTQQYSYRSGEQSINGSGRVDFNREHPPVTLQGQAENINLTEIIGDTSVAETKLNFEYNVETQGITANEIEGRANLDVAPSVIAGDTVEAHQFYADIITLEGQQRSFRLTSSLFDMEVQGQVYPNDIATQYRYWAGYITQRYQNEIRVDSTARAFTALPSLSKNIVLDGNIQAKDINLVKKYLPGFPSVNTDSRATFNVNSNGNRLLLSANVQADSLQYDQWDVKNGNAQLTASFRSDQLLKKSASVDIRANIGQLQSSSVNMDSVGINLALEQDSIRYSQYVGNIGENAHFNLDLNGSLTDSSVVASIQDFYLGNDSYAWRNQDTPALHFKEEKQIAFENFRFANEDEYFQMQGTLSSSREDSLTYMLKNINLARISELVEGRIDFEGILNGNLMTRSLTQQPTVQGQLDVSRLALDDRMVGDVSFDSQYNPSEDRFDTKIEVLTDSAKYKEYLERNDQVQQHFVLDGYFVTPKPNVAQDSLFHFDADFKQIDMWVIPLIVDDIFQQMEGQAVGNGYISGNFEDIDFHADFDAQSVFIKPRFLNTNFFVNGPVSVDRDEGVTFDSLSVMDTKGGTGTFWGNVDFNDFKPIKEIDLSLAMNNLQFMNSTMDPDVPFFGNISGTGSIRMSGTNRDLYMRTEQPVEVSNNSRVSIPLLDETELNETGQFIQFVDSFDERKKTTTQSPENIGGNAGEEELQDQIQDMTFSERFDLDLRFTTDDNIAVNLIFDPVTGEVLNARGAGQMRITMQNQEVQMFGQYRINSGTYQFVTGEIISRRLELQPGGTIVWEGPADNARLDISAIYHARPNIATLTAEGAIESQDRQSSQQVPVDLIVDITGTLNSVGNSYYFQLPSSLDLSSSSTLSYTINQINRDEQQKLLQATSILFTGQFIPTQGAGSGTASLSQNLTRGSTVLNPLLSNQVISPLLSSQINALLNSDVSRLDIDFNLNAYNEVDLGIALRLYNDRLILRREGQITGGSSQATLGDRIGDLNATYRISRRLSLTAFHRQNQVLSNFGAQQAGDVTPRVDGVGLEAQLQFNTWQELWNKIMGTSPAAAARKEEEENNEENLAEEPEKK